MPVLTYSRPDGPVSTSAACNPHWARQLESLSSHVVLLMLLTSSEL